MKNCGFTREKAKAIEERYHILYRVSDEWVAARLDEATRTGYVVGAFGLKVRTPLLAQVCRGTRQTPREAEAEGRTAGNALGQSYCLLNSRAMTEVMRQVRVHPRYRHMVRPCAQIHDANYFLVAEDLECLAWLNEVVVRACRWQELPEIAHDQVKLGGQLSVFWPTWDKEMALPNGASEAGILSAFQTHCETVLKKAA